MPDECRRESPPLSSPFHNHPPPAPDSGARALRLTQTEAMALATLAISAPADFGEVEFQIFRKLGALLSSFRVNPTGSGGDPG